MACDDRFYVEIREGETEDTILALINRHGLTLHELFREFLSCLVIEIIRFETLQMARIFWGGERVLLNEVRKMLINEEGRTVIAQIGNTYRLWSREVNRQIDPKTMTRLQTKTSTEKIGYIKN